MVPYFVPPRFFCMVSLASEELSKSLLLTREGPAKVTGVTTDEAGELTRVQLEFYSWVAGAVWVKFLAQGNNNTKVANTGNQIHNLSIMRLMPWPLGYVASIWYKNILTINSWVVWSLYWYSFTVYWNDYMYIIFFTTYLLVSYHCIMSLMRFFSETICELVELCSVTYSFLYDFHHLPC